VIVGFNGPPYQNFPKYPNFKTARLLKNIGNKMMINTLAKMASGKYIFKTDSHCMFAKGFDETLQADMANNWLVAPRFYKLDPLKWRRQDRKFYDYFYFRFKGAGPWPERTQEGANIILDETPLIHGSAWFVEKDFFLNRIGGFPNSGPMNHTQESTYLCLKTWLGPWNGRVMVNKKTWYAHKEHWEQNKGIPHTYEAAEKFWAVNKWNEKAHDMDWLIKKFAP